MGQKIVKNSELLLFRFAYFIFYGRRLENNIFQKLFENMAFDSVRDRIGIFSSTMTLRFGEGKSFQSWLPMLELFSTS